ncbi:unnamed protein product, partial [Phaeothamnion confervicola]
VAAGVSLAAGNAAAAGPSTGCDAANSGGMNMNVAAGGSASRVAALDEGETLSLDVATKGTAAITVSRDGADANILHSGRASFLNFVAPRAASYAFRLDAAAAAGATLNVRCSSLDKANAERA